MDCDCARALTCAVASPTHVLQTRAHAHTHVREHAPGDNGLLACHLTGTHGQHSGGDHRHTDGHDGSENDKDSDDGVAGGVSIVAGEHTQDDSTASQGKQGQGDGHTV